MEQPAVDFMINVFERSYRDVLVPGFIRERSEQHRYPFRRRTISVNNVNDRADVDARMQPLLQSGEITNYLFIEDGIDATLQRAGLSAKEIAPTRHYTTCSLTAVFLEGSPWLVYSDADVFLKQACDWITPSLRLMSEDSRIAVANPDWQNSSLGNEAREFKDGFGIGYGFSDQLYLVRREEFQKPIYSHFCPAGWRYPLAYRSPLFEQRVDAYMRTKRRLRATYKGATYVHDADEGAAYRSLPLTERWKRGLMLGTLKVLQRLPIRDPRFHV